MTPQERKQRSYEDAAREEDHIFEADAGLKGSVPVNAEVSKDLVHIASIRFSSDQMRRAEAEARKRGLTLSEFVRAAVDAACDGTVDVTRQASLGKIRQQARQLMAALAELESPD